MIVTEKRKIMYYELSVAFIYVKSFMDIFSVLSSAFCPVNNCSYTITQIETIQRLKGKAKECLQAH